MTVGSALRNSGADRMHLVSQDRVWNCAVQSGRESRILWMTSKDWWTAALWLFADRRTNVRLRAEEMEQRSLRRKSKDSHRFRLTPTRASFHRSFFIVGNFPDLGLLMSAGETLTMDDSGGSSSGHWSIRMMRHRCEFGFPSECCS